MKYSDDIFRLVKSLSKQEKSYFKKFATAFTEKEGSNYLKLFDSLVIQAAKSEEYDEMKIKEINFNGKFVKNLSFHKNYLYNMILISMNLYHRDNKDLISLKHLISHIHFLYDKLLFEQAYKILNKAKRIASEKENLVELIDLLGWEKLLIKNIYSSNEYSERIDDVQLQQDNTLELIRNTLEYGKIFSSIGNVVRQSGTGFLRNKEDSDEFEKHFDNDLIKNENNAKTFQSKINLNTIKMQYYLTKHEYENSYIYADRIAKLWEANIPKANGRMERYLTALNNLLTLQTRVKRYDECEQTAKLIKDVEKKYDSMITEKDRVFIFYSISVILIAMYHGHMNLEKLTAHQQNIEREIGKYENKVTLQQRIILYYFLGNSYFVTGKYEKCIHWLGKIINNERTDYSQDYQCYSRIVYLLAYYELSYFDSLEYVLKSTYHFLSKRKRVYKYENIILKYLRKSFRLKSKNELDEMLVEMKYDMEKIYNDPFEQNAFDAFNILTWLECKIKKVSMVEMIKG